MKIKAVIALSLLCVSTVICAMEDIDNVCAEHIQPYRDNYIPDTGKRLYSLEQRLEYLELLPEPCDDHDYAIILKVDVLSQMKKFDEALAELNRGLSSPNLKRKGNLLYKKASVLNILKTSGVKIEESYEDISNMLDVAFNSENDAEHLIRLQQAETAYRLKRYNEAIDYVYEGNKIQPLHRLYTLGAILSQKAGNYRMAINLVQEAVAFANNESLFLKEPDTVLSLAISLCAEGEYDWAKNIVGAAQALGDEYSQLPEMVIAAELVTQDPRCKAIDP